MTIHVLPGDSLVEQFKKTGIDGRMIVFREVLMVGPLDAETPFEFWDQRGRFILAEYGEDEIEYHERVADELEKLEDVDQRDEVILWFEYELHCSVNLWFCLSRLSSTVARVYRVEPAVLRSEDRWKGFGQMDAADLKTCFAARKHMTPDEMALGASLWDAYRKNDIEQLRKLSSANSDRFPYLKEVCEAAIVRDTKPLEILTEIKSEGVSEFTDIFAEFTLRAGVYGFGDLQVERMLERSGP